MKKRLLIFLTLLLIPTLAFGLVWKEDETSYTSVRGSFVDGQAWLDGIIPTALPNNITGITKANPGVVSSTAHGLEVGDLVYFDTLTEMTELNW